MGEGHVMEAQGRPTWERPARWRPAKGRPARGPSAAGRGEMREESERRGRGEGKRERGEKRVEKCISPSCSVHVSKITYQNHPMAKYKRFEELEGRKFLILLFDDQNQTEAIVGWLKMDF